MAQEKAYSTKAVDIPEAYSDVLGELANDLTAIIAGAHSECKADGAELSDVRIRWVKNPLDANQGKFILKAKRKDIPLIISGPAG